MELGGGLLGAGIDSENLDEDGSEPVSPFGFGPLLGDEEGRDGAIGSPHLQFGLESEDSKRGIVFFLISGGLAIGLAAVIAHVTGKAFWLH